MTMKKLLLTVAVSIGLTASTMAQVPSYVPTTGLVGWWPFNGNANDLSGNGFNGSVNGAVLTTDRFGTSNNAYSFDGSNDEIVITHNSSFNFTDFSISCWALKDNQSLYIPGIISKVQTNNLGWYLVANLNISDSICFEGGVSSGNYFGAHSAPLTPLQWVHIVGTFSPGSQKIYVNGVLISSDNNPGNLYNSSENIRIGFKNGDSYWGGKIDDIGIWNRALTPCEIAALYNGQNSTQPTTACYETATFNTTTCQWDVTGSQPNQPTTACYETATFNITTCQWDVAGTQPTQPTTACYETATFNATTCQWDVTGTQPTQPTTACYETATFNTTTCQWDVTGTQPTQPTTACYETAIFNATTCQWDVTGTQPTQPTTACYETATFNTTTCQWDVTGTQPTQPTTACYETATFNPATCQWDVTGTQTTISQPTNQTTNINTNAQFVVGSSDPSATFQWQTDLGVGFQNLNSVGQYSGTTNDTLIVSNVTLSNNNQPFRCIISSGSCSDTSNVAVLTVNNNVGINEFTQDNLFSVFPNPAQSVINVKADTRLIGNVYSIFDNTGRVILTGKINSENTTIELGNLSGGIYLFSVGENMKQTFKVIKE
jgi:hypothetical protein